MLKTSRGPVREALASLSQEGLIALERHRGARVAQLTDSDLHEIYSLRSQLERLAAEWACRNGTEGDFARMHQVLADFDDMATPRSPSAVASLDVAFHDSIFRAAHHEHLYRAWRGLRSQMFLYLVHKGALRQDVVRSWKPDHRKLFAAFDARDPRAAVALIGDHIEISFRRAQAASETPNEPASRR